MRNLWLLLRLTSLEWTSPNRKTSPITPLVVRLYRVNQMADSLEIIPVPDILFSALLQKIVGDCGGTFFNCEVDLAAIGNGKAPRATTWATQGCSLDKVRGESAVGQTGWHVYEAIGLLNRIRGGQIREILRVSLLFVFYLVDFESRLRLE
jgi:hypothetical protein